MKAHAAQFSAAAEPFLNRTRLRHSAGVGGVEEVTLVVQNVERNRGKAA